MKIFCPVKHRCMSVPLAWVSQKMPWLGGIFGRSSTAGPTRSGSSRLVLVIDGLTYCPIVSSRAPGASVVPLGFGGQGRSDDFRRYPDAL